LRRSPTSLIQIGMMLDADCGRLACAALQLGALPPQH
jgi:hypothetical protein